MTHALGANRTRFADKRSEGRPGRARHVRTLLLALLTSLGFLVAVLPGRSASAATTYQLVVSASADRSGSVGLAGRTLAGNVYVSATPSTDVSQVSFYVDDPNRAGTAYRVERGAPYDLAGTAANGSANPFNTASLADGNHNVTVVVRLSTGRTQVISANWVAANQAPPSGGGYGGGTGAGTYSLWSDSTTPAVVSDGDTSPVEVGMKFQVDVAGTVQGLRFYKSSQNTGPHVGSLWSNSGGLLAQATFTNESASGWQKVTFSQPVAVTPGAVYTVSYHAHGGRYSVDEGYFTNKGFDSGPVRALANAGVYHYGSTVMPTATWNGSNYWVDVLFATTPISDSTPTTAPAPTAPAPTAPAPTTAAPTTTAPTTTVKATTTTLGPTTTVKPTTTLAPTTTVKPTTTLAPTTTVKATTTTAAPATTAAPPTGGFPSAANTGVPAGVTLRASGGISVSVAGTVIDGLDIQGSVYIGASNVTIKNSRIRNSDYNVVRIADGVTGVVLQDVEINGLGGTEGNNGVYGRAFIQRANVWNVENGLVLDSNSTVLDSYIHDLNAPGSPHYDGVQLDGGGRSNITIRHNTIIANPYQTSAVMIDNDFAGGAHNIIVDGNKLAGGAYTVYSDASKSGGAIDGVQITNNRFGQHQWGYALIRDNTLAASSGNVDDTTGQPIVIE